MASSQQDGSSLLDQVERRFWSDSVFISHHSDFERQFWPEIVDSQESSVIVSLKFGLVSQEPEFREEVPHYRYPEMQRVILDHLGMHKLATLAETIRKVDPHPRIQRYSATSFLRCRAWADGEVSDSHVSESPLPLLGSSDLHHAVEETNLYGVTRLELFMYNGHSPWSRQQADGTVTILPISDPDVQWKLSCIFKCMPSLKEVKVVRGFGDEFLQERQTCIRIKSMRRIITQSTGAAIAADLEKADKKVEQYLRKRLPKRGNKFSNFCKLF